MEDFDLSTVIVDKERVDGVRLEKLLQEAGVESGT